jgi:hypothetical protein
MMLLQLQQKRCHPKRANNLMEHYQNQSWCARLRCQALALRYLDYLSLQKVNCSLRLAILKLQLRNRVSTVFICFLKLRNSVTEFRCYFLVFIHNVASVASKNDAAQNAPITI